MIEGHIRGSQLLFKAHSGDVPDDESGGQPSATHNHQFLQYLTVIIEIMCAELRD